MLAAGSHNCPPHHPRCNLTRPISHTNRPRHRRRSCLLPPAGAILFGLQSELMWSRVLTTAAHAALGALLLWRARRTDLTSSKDISRCYMFSWGLFYAEYLLLPLFR